MQISKTKAMLLLLIMGSMWGLQFSMLKLATFSRHSDTTILMFLLLFLSVFFLIVTVIRGERFSLTKERIWFFVVTGFLGYVAPLAATLKAAPHVSAGVLTLVASLTPVVTISVALLLKTEAVSPNRIIAVVLGLVAVLFVLWPEVKLPSYGASTWILIAAIVPLCYGVESIYVASQWPQGFTSLQVVTGEAVIAAMMVLPIYLLLGNPSEFSLSWSIEELGVLLFVLAGAVEVLVYFYLIQNTGGVFVSFGTFVSLFAGVGWGMAIFSESHGLHVWMGVIFLVFALVLICRNEQRSSSETTCD